MMAPMPRRALVILVLAVGCGPKDTTLAMPDAEEFIDSPPFVFPDAPPRADARTMPDAKINPPDAKAGTPDAPPAIDAAAGTPDAPPPIDAPPPTPDAPPPM